MTSEAPETYILTLERERGFYEARRVEYIRADLHQQALEAARAEGYAQAVDEAAKVPRAMGGSRMKFCEDAIRALSPTPADGG